jgi:molybdenum cofactor biosynthesis enzyme
MKVIWDVDARTASVEAAIDKARRFESLLLICHYCSLQTFEMVAKPPTQYLHIICALR